jgi:hypothetical protein
MAAANEASHGAAAISGIFISVNPAAPGSRHRLAGNEGR